MFPFQNIGAVIKLGLFPFLFSIIIIIAVFAYFAAGTTDMQGPDAIQKLKRALWPVQLITQLVIIVFGSMFAVGIHRYIVLGQPASWTFFRFRKYELFYILVNIVIIALMIAFSVAIFFALYKIIPIDLAFSPNKPPSIPAIIILVALWLFYIWIYVKLMLALPNAAITGRLSLVTSWRALSGNFWRFFGYAIVISLTYIVPYMILIMFLTAFSKAFSPSPLTLLLFLPAILLIVFYGVSLLAYLSFVYRQLIAKPAQDAWAQNGGTV